MEDTVGPQGKVIGNIPRWLAIASALVTVALSIANAYWSRHIGLVDEDLKSREAKLAEQRFNLEIGKGKLERYTFVQTLLEGVLSQDSGHRSISVNLIKLALGNDEAALLFAGLNSSTDEKIRELASSGTELVNKRFRVFLHLGKHDRSGSQPLKPVQDALEKPGFVIKGNDEQTDGYGPGVDYFYDSDKAGAERVAAVLNDLSGLAGQFVARRQSAKNAEGTLGVWF